ncbi:hypothetical protein [Vibrio comitans]|uniref:Uncharacterized protein n=1 Tax=Vibrio comitans NBRC 102076 TaxID=1219078 RepID=A0A4Y3IMM8_9VIBR|nr:hypothetical protein [Vibrio comitans]GEA60751.1 hypothetical protein VCO01S_19440 [Vibrio comitans NBRC 102076]
MNNYILNNCRNYNYYAQYGVKKIAYDYTLGKSINTLIADIVKGDTITVLSYSVDGKRVKALTYSVLDKGVLNGRDDNAEYGVIFGDLMKSDVIPKVKASNQYPEMFDKNGNFKQGVNVKVTA